MSNYRSSLLLLLIAFVFSTQTTHSQGFTEVSIGSGIDHMYRSQMKMGGGAAWFDMDRDGDEDLIMTGGLDGEGLFRNDGNGQFTEITYSAGLGALDSVQTLGVITCDLDNDGYREIFFTTGPGEHNYLFYNNGNGTFTDISVSAGIAADSSFATSATTFDFEFDGDLDIYVGNYVKDQTLITDSTGAVIGFDPECFPNLLFRNLGGLQFTEVAMAVGLADTGCALAVSSVGRSLSTELTIANDFGAFHVPNQYYATNQAPFPTNAVNASALMHFDEGMYGMGIAYGDYDHDMDIDYYITDIGPNVLMQYDAGFSQFNDVALAAGVQHGTLNGLNTTGWGTAFLDYDNDGYEDLYVCNGQITVAPFIANVARDPDKLYHNSGNGTFTDETMAQGVVDSGWGRGMIVGDYDLDGDQDVLTMVIHNDTASGEHSKLWRNDNVNGNHWLNVRFEGTKSARDPFGTFVSVYSPALGVPHQQSAHVINGGGSHMSQNSSILHLGLGADTTCIMVVEWPRGGMQIFDSLPSDTTITLIEDSTQFLVNLPPQFAPAPTLTVYPHPVGQTDWHVVANHLALEPLTLEIWDMQGRLVHRAGGDSNMAAGPTTFDLAAAVLPTAGNYLLRVRGASKSSSQIVMRR